MLWIVKWGRQPSQSRLIWAATDTAAYQAAVELDASLEQHHGGVLVEEYRRFGLWQLQAREQAPDQEDDQ